MGGRIEDKLDLSVFYPETFEITQIINGEKEIEMKLFSHSKSCRCIRCGMVSEHKHGTYIRKIQDLPIMGKRTTLTINAYEYQCDNTKCETSTFAEDFEGFLSHYGRMTERLCDFICMLALETSCEGCARICKSLGIRTSGDTVIRLLMKRYEITGMPDVEDIIGIDDFAMKKRSTYGTVIVNGNSHIPVTLLEGRDGETLRGWLKNNKHIKVITRDRASAYAKVIAEELPDVMQVADRFHLHQNLLEAVKKALDQRIPATIEIPHGKESTEKGAAGKKNRHRCG